MRKILFVFLLLHHFLSAQKTISVYFGVDQSSISFEDTKKLVINFQLAHCKVIEVRGYCDARGSIAYNDALAQRRINAVLQKLDDLSISHESAPQKECPEKIGYK